MSAVRTVFQLQIYLGLWKLQDKISWIKRIYPFVQHLPLTFTQITLMWLEVISDKARGSLQFYGAGEEVRGDGGCKDVYYLYLGGSITVALFGYISVFFQDTYELPFGYYVPFEWQNPQGYFYAWGYNVLAMTVCCLSNAQLDSMGCYFMLKISLLYRCLNIRLMALQQE
ncbi:hypothetical protein ACLKA7_011210 [Drosophila subpalustris]